MIQKIIEITLEDGLSDKSIYKAIYDYSDTYLCKNLSNGAKINVFSYPSGPVTFKISFKR